MTTTRSQIGRTLTSPNTPGPRLSTHRRIRGQQPVELLSVSQTAAWLGVSRSTIYRMLNTGRLPLTEFTVGNELRLSRRQLTAWLDQTPGTQPTQPATRSSRHTPSCR